MKKIALSVFCLSVFLLFISLTGYFLRSELLQSQTFYTNVNVTDTLGFDVNRTALTFGNIIRGGSSTRNIKIDNYYDFPVVVHVSADGNMKELLNFEEELYLEQGETKSVPFSVYVDDNASEGVYSGNITLLLYRK